MSVENDTELENTLLAEPNWDELELNADFDDDDEKDRLFEEKMNSLSEKYKTHTVDLKLKRAEAGLLSHCKSMDVRSFLKEEFEKHPIDYSNDDSCPESFFSDVDKNLI